MSSRNFKQYSIITLKGIAMGAADAVPGVSGGTIAFISGIYEELIATLSNIDASLFKTLFTKGIGKFWKQLNGSFLLALLTGIIISFVSFMRLAKYLIEQQPVLIWSFFFGLIIASIFYVGKQIKKWRISTFVSLVIGALFAFYISGLPSLATNNSDVFLFFAGAIAICAWILPGISGSFILLLLGAYKTLSDALNDFELKKIALFGAGAAIGLLSFSKLLKWLFKNYETPTLALVTGFIIGALNKIWPWKETLTVYSKEAGEEVPMKAINALGNLGVYQKEIGNFELHKTVLEKSVSPFMYSEINNQIDPQLTLAIVFMFIGFTTIFLLEQTAKIKKKS